MRGHLQCRDTLAGNEGCPLKTGTTVCLLYIYSYLFYCFMSDNSSLELMFMFIQPTLSFLYALLVSRVGKYDYIVV